MRYDHLFPAFNGGTVSKKMLGRLDLPALNMSCQKLTNFIPTVQGGATRRTGTKFVCRARYATNTKLIEFFEDIDTTYMLEIGATFGRVYKDNAAVLKDYARVTNPTFTGSIAGWTDSSSGTGTISHDGANNRLNLNGGGAGNEAIASQQLTSLQGGTTLYNLTVTIFVGSVTVLVGSSATNGDIHTQTLGIGTHTISFSATTTSFYLAFKNSGAVTRQVDDILLEEQYTFSHPYGTNDLDEVQYAVTGKTMLLTHPNYAPRKMTRISDISWTVAPLTPTNGPWNDLNDPLYGGSGAGHTLTPSATTGSGVTLTSSGSLFASTDVGRLFRFRHSASSEWGWGTITGYTSATQVTVTITKALSGTTGSTQWMLGAWSGTTGYPRAVAFFEDRAVFANTDYETNRIWGSYSGSLTNFQIDSDNFDTLTDACAYVYSATAINKIAWLSSGLRLFVGATNGVFTMRGGGVSGIVPTSPPEIRTATQSGSSYIRPALSQNSHFYIHTTNNKLMQLSYVYEEEEGFRADDVAQKADQLFGRDMAQVVYQETPHSNFWVRTTGGGLRAMCFYKSDKVLGWHDHEFGGTDVFVTCVGVLKNSSEDELWLITRRTVDGATVQFVEYMSPVFYNGVKEDAFFVDSGLSYTGTPITTVSGLGHLEGEEVAVLADGAMHNNLTVSGGSITLSASASEIHVGLPYISELRTVPINAGSRRGTVQGSTIRMHEIVPFFMESNGASVGYGNVEDLTEVLFNENQIYGDGPELYTGQHRIKINSGNALSPYVIIRSSGALPLTVLAVTVKTTVSEG